MSIQFPNLGINLDYVGKSIQIFGFEITFFGLVIALGMLLGMGFVILEAKRCGSDERLMLPPNRGGVPRWTCTLGIVQGGSNPVVNVFHISWK